MSKQKSDVLTFLQDAIRLRLFEAETWLADREASTAIMIGVIQRGLERSLDHQSTQSTSLGRALEINLLLVFMGCWDEWEVPWVLEQNQLIDEDELSALWSRMGRSKDLEKILRPVVQKAYKKYCTKPRSLH
jgi:hypothetical protein